MATSVDSASTYRSRATPTRLSMQRSRLSCQTSTNQSPGKVSVNRGLLSQKKSGHFYTVSPFFFFLPTLQKFVSGPIFKIYIQILVKKIPEQTAFLKFARNDILPKSISTGISMFADSNGDMIVFATDAETREAIRESQDMLLRIHTVGE